MQLKNDSKNMFKEEISFKETNEEIDEMKMSQIHKKELYRLNN